MESFKIIKVKGSSKETVEDFLAEEIPLTILVNGSELVTLLCSPSDLDELVKGFLFTSGLIETISEIRNLLINKEKWIAYIDLAAEISEDYIFKRMYTSGCGKGVVFHAKSDNIKIDSNLTIENTVVQKLMNEFQNKSRLYQGTGAVHSTALSDGKNILVFMEDIGRHNSIDKVIGYMLSRDNSFDRIVLLTSGRISSEVILKIQRCSIPVVISRGAPTNQAVRLARNMNVTLIGFARGDRMNIYSAEERLKIKGVFL